MVGVAQLVRVEDCGSLGRGFEPHLPPHKQEFFSCLFFCPRRHYLFLKISPRLTSPFRQKALIATQTKRERIGCIAYCLFLTNERTESWKRICHVEQCETSGDYKTSVCHSEEPQATWESRRQESGCLTRVCIFSPKERFSRRTCRPPQNDKHGMSCRTM